MSPPPTHGSMFLDGERARYLRLDDGFRVEGPAGAGRDFRLMRYARNELRLPDRERGSQRRRPELLPTTALFGDPRPEANAQLHWRIAPPLLALAFALLAVPLARSSPRQARYGRLLLAFLAYLVGMNLMYLGTQWLAEGKLAGAGRAVVAVAADAGAGGVAVFPRRPHAPRLRLAQRRRPHEACTPMKPFPKLHDLYVGRVVLARAADLGGAAGPGRDAGGQSASSATSARATTASRRR